MRPEFAKKIKAHDWHYAYSDDHSCWKRGQAESRSLHEMHKQLSCPFSMKELMKWAHNMVLEDFAEEDPGCWYRQPRKYKSIAAASRDDLITGADHDRITKWMSLGSSSDEIANFAR